MMAKVVQVEFEQPARLQAHEPTQPVKINRAAIGRQPHYLVFVAILREPEITRQSLVKDAERVRKKNSSVEPDLGPFPDPPRRAGKIAEAIE